MTQTRRGLLAGLLALPFVGKLFSPSPPVAPKVELCPCCGWRPGLRSPFKSKGQWRWCPDVATVTTSEGTTLTYEDGVLVKVNYRNGRQS